MSSTSCSVPTLPSLQREDPLIGEILDHRYAILGLVDEGRPGIYEAHDLQSLQRVVLRIAGDPSARPLHYLVGLPAAPPPLPPDLSEAQPEETTPTKTKLDPEAKLEAAWFVLGEDDEGFEDPLEAEHGDYHGLQQKLDRLAEGLSDDLLLRYALDHHK